MPFNHYAKLKRILSQEPEGWFIVRIPRPTVAKNFKGERIQFDHYYRLCHADGTTIEYGKFQQIKRLAHALGRPVESLPIIEQS